MAKVVVTQAFKATADEVWAEIGGFGTIDRWHPAIQKLDFYQENNGAMRRLHLPDGGVVIERLVALDEAARCYAYSITGGVMPVENYVAVLRVLEDDMGKGAIAHWTAQFDATIDAATVETQVQGIFASGLAAAKERLGA